MGEEPEQKYRMVMRRRDEKERMMKRERAGDEERDKAKDRGNFMVGQREEGNVEMGKNNLRLRVQTDSYVDEFRLNCLTQGDLFQETSPTG